MESFATGLTIVISLASAKGGHAQEIRKSPSCITWQPLRSISRKQSERSDIINLNLHGRVLRMRNQSISAEWLLLIGCFFSDFKSSHIDFLH